jgi:hypothetical protein
VLRACRERPRRHCAAEQRDEIASSHKGVAGPRSRGAAQRARPQPGPDFLLDEEDYVRPESMSAVMDKARASA